MGIFSLFGKKDRSPEPGPGNGKPARSQRDGSRASDAGDDTAREQQAQEHRQTARATALKIDRIESEMSSEFVRPAARPAAATPAATPGKSAAPAAPATVAAAGPTAAVAATPAAASAALAAASAAATRQAAEPGASLATGPSTTTFFLHDTQFDMPAADAGVEDVPLFEEAAILFANGQSAMVEHLLRDAVEADDLGSATITAWAMLFDLYQINGDQVQFENLSIAYASRFETSPPGWIEPAAPEPSTTPARAPAVPSVVFTDKLDAGVVKTLEKARSLAERNPAMRLEFMRITEVDPIGCGLLLRVLKQLQKSGIDLILVGAPELVAKVRAILEVGRRDETEAPWLLLMELLALLNQESAFEEASIDYCVTFEVSPPAFVPPRSKVTTAMEELAPDAADDDVYVMPSIIEGKTTALVTALTAFVSEHNPARIDCANLARVDVNAAGQLLAGLMPVAGDGRSIEFINVNHLVAALFNVMGLKQIIRIVTRRI